MSANAEAQPGEIGPDTAWSHFLEVVPAILWTVDTEGRLSILSAAGAAWLGVPCRLETASGHLDLIHPNERESFAAETLKARLSGTLLDIECRTRIADGSYRWTRVRARHDPERNIWHGATEDIHDRREAELALRIANERLGLALDGSSVWAWDLDVPTGRFWYSGRRQSPLGYDTDELKHDVSDLDVLVHPEDQLRVSQTFRAHLAGHVDTYQCEFRVRRKDGDWAWVADRGRVVERDGSGKPVRAIGTRADITSLKATEARLREREALLQTLLDNFADGVLAVTPDGRCAFYNKAYDRMCLDGSGAIWKNIEEMFSQYDMLDAAGRKCPDAERPIMRILRGETVRNLEATSHKRETGRRYQLIYNGQPVYGADGSLELAVVTIRDITEKREAQQALQESEARLRAVVEHLEEGVIAYGAGAPQGFANSAFRRMFGPHQQGKLTYASIGEAVQAFDLLDAEGRLLTHSERPIVRVLRGERIEKLALRVRFPDGRQLDAVFRGAPILDDNGDIKLAILVVRNVTEQNQARADLVTLQQELIHVSRTSAVGTMAGSLAHELNQPLAAIANYAAAARMMLASESMPVEPARDALKQVADEALRAGQIVHRLRRFITKGEVQRRPESLASIVREALAIAHSDTSARSTHIKLKLEPAADTVVADRIQLQQVVFNLVRNAVEAMTDGRDQELTITSRDAGGNIELLIADRGPGLAPEIEAHLFEPFVTTKATGMGIGLSICRSIMHAHEGDIRAEPRPTGGTVFILTLPRATCAPAE